MSTAPRATPIKRSTVTVTVAALLLTLPTLAASQTAATAHARWEARLATGALLPTGIQRDHLRSGPLTAAQVSWLPKSTLALTATLGWAKSRDLTESGAPRLNAFAADLGVETRTRTWALGDRARLSPIVGVGAGARIYDYRNRRAAARHNVAGYASLGGELGIGRLGVRVEARQYLAGFKPMAHAGRAEARGDLLLMTAFRFNRRAAASH